ncbi:unnamed protein product [Linum tenue]|uniref:Uncharacterized protein n=1 Tax=Linum tenue TaxID=586396 RepID=A0AAV0JD85_9ROSI|nr:unnamed protein product [Linum tenue]
MRELKLEKELDEEEAAAGVEIWSYVFGFTKMAVVKCAVELGIADAIENHGPDSMLSLGQLSSVLNCDEPSLSRIMRFLTHHRIFEEKLDSDGTAVVGYSQTPLSRRLIRRREGDDNNSGGNNSMADFLLLEGSRVMLEPWLFLSSRVRDGSAAPAFEQAHGGEDVWKFAEDNPGHGKLIDDAMACNARLAVPAIVQGSPGLLDGVETMVDVGGGNGTALRLFVESCPWIHGINFDLPHVVAVAPESKGVAHVGGDMFQSVPKADVAFLMHTTTPFFGVIREWLDQSSLSLQQVLHDWNDEDCIKILKNCREAISEKKGRVIIAEAVVDQERDGKLEHVRLMLDMVMMAHTNSGKERTLKEWESVLHQAGFTRVTVTPIDAVQSVIQAFP